MNKQTVPVIDRTNNSLYRFKRVNKLTNRNFKITVLQITLHFPLKEKLTVKSDYKSLIDILQKRYLSDILNKLIFVFNNNNNSNNNSNDHIY